MTVTEPTPKAAEAMTSVRIITVPADRAGQRLDNFLLGQLKGAPRSLIYKLVRSGQVRVNGGRAKAERKLEGGDEVRVPPVRLNEEGDKAGPPAAFMKRLEDAIVFEDDRLLALNKPSGVASHGGSGISFGAIETLRALRPGKTLELVHRLDRDTSGVMIFALTPHAQRHLGLQFENRQTRKTYVARVWGEVEGKEGTIDLPPNVDWPNRPLQMVDHVNGRPAVTDWRVLRRGHGETRMRLMPRTG